MRSTKFALVAFAAVAGAVLLLRGLSSQWDAGLGFAREDWAQIAPPVEATLRTPQAAGALALVPAVMLFVLYLYRPRPYLIAWIGAWASVAVMMNLASAGSDLLLAHAAPVRGRLLVGLSQCFGVLHAALLCLSAWWYRAHAKVPTGLSRAIAGVWLWIIITALALGVSWALSSGYLAMGTGFAVGGIAYLQLARRTRIAGAVLIALGMFGVGLTDVWVGALVLRGLAGPEIPNSFIFANVLWKAVVALGMHLFVFEDMTSELRDTNRDLASAQERLQTMAITDALTGCYNRRFFDEVVANELRQQARHHLPLSLLFVDCDNFKRVNDVLGHDAGDRVLAAVGAMLRARVRHNDYVFRWGGDEFLILLFCDEPQALGKARELQEAFRQHPVRIGLPPGTGLTIGCVAVPYGTTDLMPLVHAADQRMYAQKERSA